MPGVSLVLRIRVPDEHAVCILGTKYGAELSDVINLFTLAKKFGLNVVGVSFHVGSGCTNAEANSVAIHNSRYVFDIAKEMGFNITLLDIGGGFPGSTYSPVTFEEVTSDQQKFRSLIFDHYVVSPKSLTGFLAAHFIEKDPAPPYGDTAPDDNFNNNKEHLPTTLWGPTCDSMDCIKKDFLFPEMQVGEWIIFPDMGAYTISAASNFNGFRTPGLKYYIKNYAYGVISKFYNWNKISKLLRVRSNQPLIGETKVFRSGSLPLNLIEVN